MIYIKVVKMHDSLGLFMVFNVTFQQYFSYIMAVSFIGGKPPTCRKSLTNFIT
jgi:hypothetical protein